MNILTKELISRNDIPAFQKLDILEKLFLFIYDNRNGLYTHSSSPDYTENCPLTSTQQEHIGMLKKAFVWIVSSNLADKAVRERAENPCGLVDFYKTETASALKPNFTKTRAQINMLKNSAVPTQPH